MRYYIIANDDIIIKSSKKETEKLCYELEKDDSIFYLEYGILDPDSRPGRSTIVVFKNGESDELK